MNARAPRQTGFSLAEVVVALLILSVGVLAMGASTGYVVNKNRNAELRLERMTAVRQAAEIIRAADPSDVEQLCASRAFELERYTVTCEVGQESEGLLRVRLVSRGPGYRAGEAAPDVAEAFVLNLARPDGGS